MFNFEEYTEMNEAAESLQENREQNIQRIVKILDNSGFEVLDNLTDKNLEDLVLRLTAKDPKGDADRLDQLIDVLFGANAEVPYKLKKDGTPKRSPSGKNKGQPMPDKESEEFKNLLPQRLGGSNKVNELKKAIKGALKKSSAPTPEKLLYIYRLTQDSNLFDISKLIKAQITNSVVDLLPAGLPKSVSGDFFSAIAPVAPTGLGPGELWLVLHIKNGKLDGGKGGAAGDINTMDGNNSIEVKGADGMMTFGNPKHRGTGWSGAARVIKKAVNIEVGKKEFPDFMNHTGEAYKAFSSLPKTKQSSFAVDIMRAYMDPYTFDDKDVKDYASNFLKLSGDAWREYHMKMSVYGYWKYKDKASGGSSFKAILFLDKRSGRFATINCDGGKVKVPSGMKISSINWINDYTNYADGSTVVSF